MITKLAPTDPRLRIIAACALIIAISQISHLGMAALTFAALLGGSFGHIRLRRLWHVEGFVALLFLMLPLTMPGTPMFTLGPLAPSVEGIERAALIACKIGAAALVMMAFLGPLDPNRLAASLHALRLPKGLVRLFALVPRYVGVISDEAHRLRMAMRMRGFRPGTNRHSWRSYGNLIGMLILRALARAQRIEDAMKLRGFTGQIPQSPFGPLRRADMARMGGSVTVATLLLIVDKL